jgi:transposase
MKDFLSTDQIQKLKQAHRESKKKKDVKNTDKIKAILLLNDGYSYEEIAKILLLDDSSVRRYYEIYSERNLKGLLENNNMGRTSYLSQKLQKKLAKHLKKNIYPDAKSIIEYIKGTFNITYTPKGIVPLLHKLGFVYKKTKRVPGKADPEAQEKFINETYKEIKEIKGENDRIYFMDGVHPQHNSIPAYGWIKKGTTKEIKSNTGRSRININGAIDIESLDLIHREDESINADSTIALFKQIEEKNQLAEHIFIIADNARYYRSELVTEYLKNSKINIIFLPPYSPNLNLIERLWRFLHKKIQYNRYYETYLEFKNACLDLLNNLHKYEKELRSLLTENFEITGNNFT